VSAPYLFTEVKFTWGHQLHIY